MDVPCDTFYKNDVPVVSKLGVNRDNYLVLTSYLLLNPVIDTQLHRANRQKHLAAK
jgi:hypothetical protein